MKYKLRSLFILIAVAAISVAIWPRLCRYFLPKPFPSEPTVPLCFANGTDEITLEHISNLLALNGIESNIEGSRVYVIQVEKSKLGNAITLLEESASNEVPTIVVERRDEELIWVEGDKTDYFDIELELDQNIGNAGLPASNEYANILYAIRQQTSSSHPSNRRQPIVKRMKGFKRTYLDINGNTIDSYDVDISFTSDGASFIEHFQIMNQLQEIHRLGSVKAKGSGTQQIE